MNVKLLNKVEHIHTWIFVRSYMHYNKHYVYKCIDKSCNELMVL